MQPAEPEAQEAEDEPEAPAADYDKDSVEDEAKGGKHMEQYPSYQGGSCPDKNSASFEYRPQRIIFWIPPLDPAPRLVNPRSFRVSGTPSRKRKRSNDNEEERTSSDAEEGHVYKKYAKIILKLDNWNLEKDVDASPPPNAVRAYQRRKSNTRILCKEEACSALAANKTLPGSPQASKKITVVERDEHLPSSLSADDGENANGVAPDETMGRELPSRQCSRRLSLRKRKTVSHFNFSSSVSKVKMQKRSGTTAEKQDEVVPLHTSVSRFRKRVMTQTKGKSSTSAALETNLVKTPSLAVLDDCKNKMASGLGTTRISESSAGVPASDQLTVDHFLHHRHGYDVVASSNNAMALNSRTRTSFLGRKAGSVGEEELKTRIHVPRPNVQTGNVHSHMNNSMTTVSAIRRDHGNGRNRLEAKLGWAAPRSSYSHMNGNANGHSVELIRKQGTLFKNSLSRGLHGGPSGVFERRSLPFKSSRYSTNHAADEAAMIRSKLEEVGGLTEWLIGGGLGVFVDLFQERKLAETDLLHLTMGSLKEISGVQAVGPRRKLMWMIEHLL